MASLSASLPDAGERREANSVGLAMLAAGASITLAEIVVQTISYSRLPNAIGYWNLVLAPWWFGAIQILVWRLAAPLGARAAVVVLAATAVQLVMVTQTRGAWIWWGTFDRYQLSRWTWYGPLLLGSALGAGLAFTLWRDRRERFASDRAAGIGFLGSFVVAGLSMLTSRGEPIESEFAPTRYLALAGLVLALGLGLAFARNER